MLRLNVRILAASNLHGGRQSASGHALHAMVRGVNCAASVQFHRICEELPELFLGKTVFPFSPV